MAKAIKFDLPIDGVKVASLDDLQDHFTTEVIGHFRSGLLSKWLRPRGLNHELTAIEALGAEIYGWNIGPPEGPNELEAVKASAADDDAVVLKELCRIFKVEADDDVIAAAIAKAKQTWNPGDTFQDGPGCPKLVVIPSGSFMMGSPEKEAGSYDDEHPMHEVRIDYRLAVGVYPVTFDEWNACVSDGGCGGYVPEDNGWGRGNRPVVNVSWEDAKRYVGWLSWKTGKGYRLLSESEWEYVARAGTKTSYWWGSSIGGNRANCDGCGSRYDNERTSPVGSFSENAFGLYDVHGNVQEWVEDCWNGDYDGAPTDGSARESEDCDCEQRVLRGGSWFEFPRSLRSAYRHRGFSGNRNFNAGFRVARTLTP